jgi:hypothetical protein
MKNLLSNVGQFLEAHIEKLVLVISLCICFWLLITKVALSPNRMEYGGQTFSPAGVDDYIYTNQVEPVREVINGEPQFLGRYETRRDGYLDGYIDPNNLVREGIRGRLDKGFKGLFASAIDYINDDLYPPLPRYSTSTKKTDKRDYRTPVVGRIEDVDIEYIRAAAYVPVGPLRDDLPYTKASHNLDDVDIVTVQGTFNMALLMDRFYKSFAGEDLPEASRDPALAKPVFAAVHLQRQKQLAHGDWSDWQDVPRCGTEHRRELFRIIEQVAKLPPGGVKMRILQYDRPEVMSDLLQPLPYQMASPYEAWFPPALHRDFLAAYEKMKIQERRTNREEHAGSETGTDRRSLRGRGSTADARMRGGDSRGTGGLLGFEDTTRAGGGVRGRRGRTDSSTRTTDPGGRGSRRTRRPESGMEDMRSSTFGLDGEVTEESAISEVYNKLMEIFITPQVDIYELEELVFWAHDDTLEPGSTYRYRIRLGVFNPVAGIHSKGDATNAVILWSEFSEVTAPVEIPTRQYFFANKYHAESEILVAEVAQFVLGYWHLGKFQVKPGEVLGQVKEVTSETDDPKSSRRTRATRDFPGALSRPNDGVPETIDYSTGIVWIGVEPVDNWSGSGSRFRRQSYYQMLYTRHGTDIQRVPIGVSNWPSDLADVYNNINRMRREAPEALRAFGSGIEGATSLFDYREGIGAYGIDEFGFGRGN